MCKMRYFHFVLGSRIAKQITLLCHIIPPRGRLVVKRKHWKFSTQECVDSIIIHATVGIMSEIIK